MRTARQSSKISSLNRLWSFAPLASSEMAKADTGRFYSASDPEHGRQIVLNTWVTLFLLSGGQMVAVGGVLGDGLKAVVSEEAATASRSRLSAST